MSQRFVAGKEPFNNDTEIVGVFGKVDLVRVVMVPREEWHRPVSGVPWAYPTCWPPFSGVNAMVSEFAYKQSVSEAQIALDRTTRVFDCRAKEVSERASFAIAPCD